MIVKNPTDKEIYTVIKGTRYTVPANGELPYVPAEHAIHWKTKVHEFVILLEDTPAEVKAKEAPVEETPTEPIPEVVEEAPEKKSSKKTTKK